MSRDSVLEPVLTFEVLVPDTPGKHDSNRFQQFTMETRCTNYLFTVIGHILDSYKSRNESITKWLSAQSYTENPEGDNKAAGKKVRVLLVTKRKI